MTVLFDSYIFCIIEFFDAFELLDFLSLVPYPIDYLPSSLSVYSLAVLFTLEELAIIDSSIRPLVNSFPVLLVSHVLALVDPAI